ncbi:unnamed protein product [Acanthosepion pharaonis]|uniref:Uncharacterized protein n=1 Tax=Acanthosepion pharaonis TaxID=158019 RepID=A0A812CT10_ACAPH|nr:unnamed protein product [Sepia pharaonis]
MNRSNVKTLLIVSFDYKGIVHHMYVPLAVTRSTKESLKKKSKPFFLPVYCPLFPLSLIFLSLSLYSIHFSLSYFLSSILLHIFILVLCLLFIPLPPHIFFSFIPVLCPLLSLSYFLLLLIALFWHTILFSLSYFLVLYLLFSHIFLFIPELCPLFSFIPVLYSLSYFLSSIPVLSCISLFLSSVHFCHLIFSSFVPVLCSNLIFSSLYSCILSSFVIFIFSSYVMLFFLSCFLMAIE